MKRIYPVALSAEERDSLNDLLLGEQASNRQQVYAEVPLLADEGKPDARISRVLPVSSQTALRMRQRFSEGGLQRVLNRPPVPAQA